MKKKNIPFDEILTLHQQGLYDKDIAEILGCSRSNITIRLNKAGITDRHGKKDDKELCNRISQSLIGRYVGEKNPNYKGYNDEKRIARGIFKTISKKLLRENDYTCQICGKHGGDLETHHIKPFSVIMEEFFENGYSGDIFNLYYELTNYPSFMDENNLVVCCKNCHHLIHYSDNPEFEPYRWNKCND